MSNAPASGKSSKLSPQEALSVLGDETRLGILQAIGEADEPLRFTELFDRSECETSANFSYHLRELKGQFVHETDNGYLLRQAGRRVIEAVLAEAVPDAEPMERTVVDWSCFRCGARVEVGYQESHVGLYCPGCGGTRDGRSTTTAGRLIDQSDVLGILDLPPAGTIERSPLEILHAAHFWTTSEALALAKKICPRCSAGLDVAIHACAEHDSSDGLCVACGQRFAIVLEYDCRNCIFSVKSPIGTYLFDNTDLIEFMIRHDIDPFSVPGFHFCALDESVRSTDPFEADLTFSVNGESISFRIDEQLEVEERSQDSEAANGS